MARLPIPGQDDGTWGDILNDFLAQAHTTSGALKSGSVTAASIQSGTISEALLDSSVQTKLNALGSHTHPSTDISDSTATGRSVLTAVDPAAARAAIGAGTSNLALGTTSSTAKAGDYVPTKADVGLGNVDNTSDLNKPISTATQTALNAKADASSVSAKVLLIDNTASLPAGTPAGVVVVVKS